MLLSKSLSSPQYVENIVKLFILKEIIFYETLHIIYSFLSYLIIREIELMQNVAGQASLVMTHLLAEQHHDNICVLKGAEPNHSSSSQFCTLLGGGNVFFADTIAIQRPSKVTTSFLRAF